MTKKKQNTNNNSEKIMLGVLIVLIVFSGVQAFQLNEIRQDINEGSFASTNTAAPTSTNPSSTGAPKSLNDLPQMVGGC